MIACRLFYELKRMKYATGLKGAGFVLIVVILIVGHGIVLYRISSHITWTIVVALVLLVLLKHVGFLGPVFALFKRRFRNSR